MELIVTFDRFIALMNWNREDVLKEGKARQARGVSDKRVKEASEKLKNEFNRLFGADWEELKENIDQRNWKQNVRQFWKGNDVNFGLKVVCPEKRKRKSANDSLNESFLLGFEESTSLDDVEEVVRLRAENQILHQQVDAMQELFIKKRVPTPRSRNSGGSTLCYSGKMKAMAISLLAQGESSMSVHRILKTMTLITPELLENDGVCGIPCHKTLSNWRDKIPLLNMVQAKQFIAGSDHFVLGMRLVFTTSINSYLAVDESEISQTSLVNLGIFDADCNYHCLGSRVLVKDKTAPNVAELMFEMLKEFPELLPKLHAIISDQAAYQLAANRRLGRMLGRDLQQLTCSLHTVSNGDDLFTNRLQLAKQAVHCCKLMFGQRQQWDHSDSSLRSELEIGLQIEVGRRFSPFKSDRGSRFAVGYVNAINLIKHRDLVLRVLETKRAKKISYASQLKELLTTRWNECCLQLGMFVCHWRLVLNPFYSAMGKRIDIGTGKAHARELQDKYQQLVDSDNKFNTMMSFVDDSIMAQYPCLSVVRQMWQTCEASDRDGVNAELTVAVERTARKVFKDTKLVLELIGEHSEILPFSNNRCESSFSLIKVILVDVSNFSVLNSAFPSPVCWYVQG